MRMPAIFLVIVLPLEVTAVSLFMWRREIKRWLARRRYRRESVAHPERVCHNCGGHATMLEAMQFPHKTVYFCKDTKTCAATIAYQRMLQGM
jgi:hypothetical protein